MHKTKRPLSFLLAVLMIVSMFAAVPFTASAEDKVIGEGVIFKQGDTIVLPGNGIYIKRNQYESAREVHVNGTVTQFESDGYSYRLKIERVGCIHLFRHFWLLGGNGTGSVRIGNHI